MAIDEQIDSALLDELENWRLAGKHKQIAEKLQSLPQTKTSYELSMILARALNNLGQYQTALDILQSLTKAGEKDKEWYFRTGYSLFYIDGREAESVAYLEKSIELGDNFPGTYQMLREAIKYLSESEQAIRELKDFEFIPKALINLHINMRMNAKHRHILIDEISYMFIYKKWGKPVAGKTNFSDDGEPESCDIQLEVAQYSQQMRDDIFSMASRIVAAKGSSIEFCNADRSATNKELDNKVSIGTLSGIGIYLKIDELPLPKEDSQNCIGNVFSYLFNLLVGNGALFPSNGENSQEVALYFYGEGGFETMHNKVKDYLQSNPLTKNCRIVELA